MHLVTNVAVSLNAVQEGAKSHIPITLFLILLDSCIGLKQLTMHICLVLGCCFERIVNGKILRQTQKKKEEEARRHEDKKVTRRAPTKNRLVC